MSLAQKITDYETAEQDERSRSGYASVLVFLCIALALVVASVTFAPVATAIQTTSDVSLVGP